MLKFTEETTLKELMQCVKENPNMDDSELAEATVEQDIPMRTLMVYMAKSQFKMARVNVVNQEELDNLGEALHQA